MEAKKNNLLVIDGDFILYHATQGKKVFDKFGDPVRENNKFVYTDKSLEEVHEGVNSIMHNIFNTSHIHMYVGFLGGKRCFRYDIYPEYKANRKDRVKPKFWQECKDYLIQRWNFEICDYIEADDAVNITKNKLDKEYDCTIVTTDKDLMHCIEGTYMNAKDMTIFYTNDYYATYNFWYSMIVGDTADNIKGLKGKGPKFAEKFLEEISPKTYQAYEESIKNLYESTGEDFELQFKLLKMLDDKEDFVIPKIHYHIQDILLDFE